MPGECIIHFKPTCFPNAAVAAAATQDWYNVFCINSTRSSSYDRKTWKLNLSFTSKRFPNIDLQQSKCESKLNLVETYVSALIHIPPSASPSVWNHIWWNSLVLMTFIKSAPIHQSHFKCMNFSFCVQL